LRSMIDMNMPSLKKAFKLAAGAMLAAPAAPAFAASSLSIAGWTLMHPTALVIGILVPALMWKFLESMPPKPKIMDFAPIRFLFALESRTHKPTQMPWWQKAIFFSTCAAVGLGIAHPVRVSDIPVDSNKPVMLVVDNDFSSAHHWTALTKKMNDLVDRSDGLPIIILKTAKPADGGAIKATPPINATQARAIIRDMQPEAWPADRKAAVEALKAVDTSRHPSIIWLSNGLADKDSSELMEILQAAGSLTVLKDVSGVTPHLLMPPEAGVGKLTVKVRRADTTKDEVVVVNAYNESSNLVGGAEAHFKAGQAQTEAQFDVSNEQRNQFFRLALRDENSAGAVILMDDRWRLRTVGIVKDDVGGKYHESKYIEAALQPYAHLKFGGISELIKQKPAVIILPDSVGITDTAHKELERWVQEDGGTLLRFAGPNLAEQKNVRDTLLPVELNGLRDPLSPGGKGKPAQIIPFGAKSHFSGIKIPEGITVTHEVAAMSRPDLDEHVWASLDDGSAFVTGKQMGKGQVILIHTSTDPEWSNFAIKGGPLFIEMQREIIASSQNIGGDSERSKAANMPPLKVLDGTGAFSNHLGVVHPLTPAIVEGNIIGPHSPPGLYGYKNGVRYAHNLAPAIPEMKPLPPVPNGVVSGIYEIDKKERDWPPGLMLGGALALLMAGGLVRLWQQARPVRITTPTKGQQGPV
jgi:hypothetical protein